jgi:hypothetical protein
VEGEVGQAPIPRRAVLKRLAAGVAVAWSAPVLTSIRLPASAAPMSPGLSGCCECRDAGGGFVECGSGTSLRECLSECAASGLVGHFLATPEPLGCTPGVGCEQQECTGECFFAATADFLCHGPQEGGGLFPDLILRFLAQRSGVTENCDPCWDDVPGVGTFAIKCQRQDRCTVEQGQFWNERQGLCGEEVTGEPCRFRVQFLCGGRGGTIEEVDINQRTGILCICRTDGRINKKDVSFSLQYRVGPNGENLMTVNGQQVECTPGTRQTVTLVPQIFLDCP